MLSFVVADLSNVEPMRLVGADWPAFEPGFGSIYVCGFVNARTLSSPHSGIVKKGTLITNLEWELFLNGSAKAVFGVSSTGIIMESARVVSDASLSVGKWYFVEGWRNGAAETVNVAFTDCCERSVSPAKSISWSGGVNTSSYHVVVGSDGFLFNVNGRIHSVLVANQVPSVEQRNRIFNRGTGQQYANLPAGLSLTAFWELNETAGVRFDSHAGGYDLSTFGAVSSGVRQINDVAFADPYEADEAIYRHWFDRRMNAVFNGIVDDGELPDDAHESGLRFPYVRFRVVRTESSYSNQSQHLDKIVEFAVYESGKSECRQRTNQLLAAYSEADLSMDAGAMPLCRVVDPPMYTRETPECWVGTFRLRLIQQGALDVDPAYGCGG